jgi:heat shock protein HtpX
MSGTGRATLYHRRVPSRPRGAARGAETPPGPLIEPVSANARRAALVLAAVAAVVMVVVGGVGLALGAGPVALVAGLALGILAALWLWTGSETRALRAIGARPVTEAEEPGLHNLTEGLCAVAGLPKPGLYVVDDEARNACAFGRNPRRAALVVTRGLLDALERIELEGVVAHELAHVKALDTRVATLAVALRRLGAGAVAAIAGSDREEAADVAGVALTRYPPGLRRALEKLAAGRTEVGTGQSPTDLLWLASSSPLRATLHHRIDALREL